MTDSNSLRDVSIFEVIILGFEKKEREIRTRIHLPQEELKENAYYSTMLKEKTHELMKKVFNKDYTEIKEKDLNEFVSGLCSRLMLFDGDFPSFLPYLVKEVVNHPKINQIDKEQLESYSEMFELKWKEDPEKPLMISPIYTKDSRVVNDDLEKENISKKMRNASIPYLYELKSKVMKYM